MSKINGGIKIKIPVIFELQGFDVSASVRVLTIAVNLREIIL